MKVKSGFMLRKVAGSNVVIPVGTRGKEFNGMITMNDSAAFLWNKLEHDINEEALVQAVMDAYPEAEMSFAQTCVREFVATLKENDLLD